MRGTLPLVFSLVLFFSLGCSRQDFAVWLLDVLITPPSLEQSLTWVKLTLPPSATQVQHHTEHLSDTVVDLTFEIDEADIPLLTGAVDFVPMTSAFTSNGFDSKVRTELRRIDGSLAYERPGQWPGEVHMLSYQGHEHFRFLEIYPVGGGRAFVIYRLANT